MRYKLTIAHEEDRPEEEKNYRSTNTITDFEIIYEASEYTPRLIRGIVETLTKPYECVGVDLPVMD